MLLNRNIFHVRVVDVGKLFTYFTVIISNPQTGVESIRFAVHLSPSFFLSLSLANKRF